MYKLILAAVLSTGLVAGSAMSAPPSSEVSVSLGEKGAKGKTGGKKKGGKKGKKGGKKGKKGAKKGGAKKSA